MEAIYGACSMLASLLLNIGDTRMDLKVWWRAESGKLRGHTATTGPPWWRGRRTGAAARLNPCDIRTTKPMRYAAEYEACVPTPHASRVAEPEVRYRTIFPGSSIAVSVPGSSTAILQQRFTVGHFKTSRGGYGTRLEGSLRARCGCPKVTLIPRQPASMAPTSTCCLRSSRPASRGIGTGC
jgi:hypothetical protein